MSADRTTFADALVRLKNAIDILFYNPWSDEAYREYRECVAEIERLRDRAKARVAT